MRLDTGGCCFGVRKWTASLVRVHSRPPFFQHVYFLRVNIKYHTDVTALCVCLNTKGGGGTTTSLVTVPSYAQRQNSVELMITRGFQIASLNASWTSQCL